MTVMQLLIFSPFLVLGLLTVSVTVTKGKRPRQKLDFEIHSFFYIRILFFRLRLNILIFLPILG